MYVIYIIVAVMTLWLVAFGVLEYKRDKRVGKLIKERFHIIDLPKGKRFME